MTPNAEQDVASGPQQSIVPFDEAKVVQEVDEFFERKREDRRPYEHVWYQNAAALNGKTQAKFSPYTNGLEVKGQPSHRRYLNINIIWGKFQAKLAKMTNSEPRAVVIAANNEYQEILNARMSQQALLYLSRKGNWQSKYELAVAQAELTGKSFLWLYWDDALMASFKDPATGQVFDSPEGDVRLTVGSAFELLVDDLSEPRIGFQKKIQRVSAMLMTDAIGTYPKLQGQKLTSDVNESDLFQYERQIADLGSGATASGASKGATRGKGEGQYILRKEHFEAPTREYPKGRYAVVIGKILVKYQEELPYGFHDIETNPFPVEEVYADLTPGRFWPQTMIERLRPAQDAFDTVISKILEDMDVGMHGKWFIPRAMRIPKGAINSEPGQVIEYNAFPGMPLPQLIQARGVSADAWKALDWFRNSFDDVTNIYPSTLGQAGGAESGFQTNLLQEAADAVYGPNKRRNERTWQGLLFKARRLMKQGYTVDRLISITSKNQIPAVFEFQQSQIDEHAEITVEIGSALSDLKATRLQQAMELNSQGVFGQANSPAANRAMLQLVDLGGIEEQVDPTFNDTNRALRENMFFTKGQPVDPPAPWQTDGIHVEIHFSLMNSAEWDSLEPTVKSQIMEHVVLHLRRHNPMMGLEIAQMLVGTAQDPESATRYQELLMQMQSQADAMMATQQPPEGEPSQAPPPSQ